MTQFVRSALVATALVVGLSLSSAAFAQEPGHNDPIEPLNRGIFGYEHEHEHENENEHGNEHEHGDEL